VSQPPAPRETPLSFYLSKRDFQAVYALDFALQISGENDEVKSFGDGMRQAIRRLHRAGYRFSALDVFEDGRIQPSRAPICPENEMYLHMLSMGKAPDYRVALDRLLELLDRDLPREYRLRELALWAKKLVADQVAEQESPSEEWQETTTEALAAVGMPVIKGGVH
jgi:hypothetical protein